MGLAWDESSSLRKEGKKILSAETVLRVKNARRDGEEGKSLVRKPSGMPSENVHRDQWVYIIGRVGERAMWSSPALHVAGYHCPYNVAAVASTMCLVTSVPGSEWPVFLSQTTVMFPSVFPMPCDEDLVASPSIKISTVFPM